MSNHSGSYMLNHVLFTAKEMGFFDAVGKEKAAGFALELLRIGDMHDCNYGEILEEIGEELGVCCCCGEETEQIEDGFCPECVSKYR